MNEEIYEITTDADGVDCYIKRVEYRHCVFYDKAPQETAYCDYKQEYLDNGCENGCAHCRRIEEIREMVKEQEN